MKRNIVLFYFTQLSFSLRIIYEVSSHLRYVLCFEQNQSIGFSDCVFVHDQSSVYQLGTQSTYSMTSPIRKVDRVTPGSRSPFGFNTSADIPSDGSPTQYDRETISCHTASTLVSGQKHWKCNCRQRPFYQVAAVLTMATRPTMGFPLCWVRASSGFGSQFLTCKKIP